LRPVLGIGRGSKPLNRRWPLNLWIILPQPLKVASAFAQEIRPLQQQSLRSRRFGGHPPAGG
jgi:hypothetical protein